MNLFHSIYLRSVLILAFHLRLDLNSNLIASSFPTKILYSFLYFLLHDAFPDHFTLLEFIILISFDVTFTFLNYSLRNFLQSPMKPSHLGIHIVVYVSGVR
jgi:hypothetical protein